MNRSQESMKALMEMFSGIPFAKYHAAGNDFVVMSDYLSEAERKAARKLLVPTPSRRVPLRRMMQGNGAMVIFPPPKVVRSICDRHTGMGADGLVVMSVPGDQRHQGRMRIFNADGSEAEMSGNGIRCAAAYLLENARARPESNPRHRVAKRAGRLRKLEIETAAGVKSVLVVKAEERRWVFRVGMGEPILQAEKIPFKGSTGHSSVIEFPLETSRGILKVTVTSMGNPHCTVPVSDFDALDWVSLGREIETSQLFPNRTNVEFVRVISRKEIEVRFWERGVGKTQSSGTGSCAAVVACVLNGWTGRKVRVRTLAGTLEVAWPEGKEVTLTGPVELIARGTYYFSNRRDR